MWKPGKALNLSISNRTTIPAEIADCKGLKVLDLSHTKVSDLTPLAKLTNLTWLSLSHTQVSDFKPLAKLTRLEGLYLSHTQVSDNAETVTKLRAQGCRIYGWEGTA